MWNTSEVQHQKEERVSSRVVMDEIGWSLWMRMRVTNWKIGLFSIPTSSLFVWKLICFYLLILFCVTHWKLVSKSSRKVEEGEKRGLWSALILMSSLLYLTERFLSLSFAVYLSFSRLESSTLLRSISWCLFITILLVNSAKTLVNLSLVCCSWWFTSNSLYILSTWSAWCASSCARNCLGWICLDEF